MTMAAESDLGPIRAALGRMNLLPSRHDPRLVQVYRGASYALYWAQLKEGKAYLKQALPGSDGDLRPPAKRIECEQAYHLAGAAAPDSLPGRAPVVLGLDSQSALLVLEHLAPKLFHPWVMDLREGRIDLVAAHDVGQRLGGLHSHSSRTIDKNELTSAAEFHRIYMSRHLDSAAGAHPALAQAIAAVSRAAMQNRCCLLHGNLDPQMILLGQDGPVFMGGDLAWQGDPAWDLAHLFSRLMFMGLSRRWAAQKIMEGVAELVRSYLERVDWEPGPELESRASRLVGGLLLAGLDGEAPQAGPGDHGAKERARAFGIDLLTAPRNSLDRLQEGWLALLSA